MQPGRSRSRDQANHLRKQAAVTTSTTAHEPPDLALRRATGVDAAAQSFNYAQCPGCRTGIVLNPPRRIGERFICESCGEPLVVTGPYAPDVLHTRISTVGAVVIGVVLIAAVATAWMVLSSPGDTAPVSHPTETTMPGPGLADEIPPHATPQPPQGPRPTPEYVYIVADDDTYHSRRDCTAIPATATIEAVPLREATRQGRIPCADCGR